MMPMRTRAPVMIRTWRSMEMVFLPRLREMEAASHALMPPSRMEIWVIPAARSFSAACFARPPEPQMRRHGVEPLDVRVRIFSGSI